MSEGHQPTDQEVLQFIYDRIESVPHLEALLLIWGSEPANWSVDELAQRLYVERCTARGLLRDLAAQQLIVIEPGPPEFYRYDSISDVTDRLVAAVHAKYRAEIVAVSTMIHRKASSSVRDFADAFRFTKERP